MPSVPSMCILAKGTDLWTSEHLADIPNFTSLFLYAYICSFQFGIHLGHNGSIRYLYMCRKNNLFISVYNNYVSSIFLMKRVVIRFLIENRWHTNYYKGVSTNKGLCRNLETSGS